jgi:hypothetical protein
MARARQMIKAHPTKFNGDADLLAGTIELLQDCANTCTLCADSCLSERDIALLARCIRLNQDCVDICDATGRVISRLTEYDWNVTRPLLEACISVCRSCGDECARNAEHMPHCRVCADACRECEEACRALLAELA